MLFIVRSILGPFWSLAILELQKNFCGDNSDENSAFARF